MENKLNKLFIGALVDVSGSMKDFYQNKTKGDLKMKKLESIFDLLINITSDSEGQVDNNEFFCLAFGLESRSTCDLILLLEKLDFNKKKYIEECRLKQSKETSIRIEIKKCEDIIKNLSNPLTFMKVDISLNKQKIEELKQNHLQIYKKYRYIQSKNIKSNNYGYYLSGYEPLIDLVSANGAEYCDYYIRKYLSHNEAGQIFEYLYQNKDALYEYIRELPECCKNGGDHYLTRGAMGSYNPVLKVIIYILMLPLLGMFSLIPLGAFLPFLALFQIESKVDENSRFERSYAYNLKNRIILDAKNSGTFSISDEINDLQERIENPELHLKNKLDKKLNLENDLKISLTKEDISYELKGDISELIENEDIPKLYKYQEVITILKSLKNSENKLKTEIINSVEKYIYGCTPMCKSLDLSTKVFENKNEIEKILFILSDGQSTDGNPVPLCKNLKNLNVKIVTCLISESNLQFKKKLYDKPESNWTESEKVMFNMSSAISTNTNGLHLLQQHGWEIPISGECHLYSHVNHPSAIEEFSQIVNRLSEVDAIADLIGKVSLEKYINQTLDNFIPCLQEDETCYANATAAALHLAMSRIKGRNVLPFEEIKKLIIHEYGSKGANTKKVLEKYCSHNRLKFKKIDENGARKAILERRPCVARFRLYKSQWDKFSYFFKNNPKGILEKNDLHVNLEGESGGHAVVLIKCSPNSLTLMNSWGITWGDNGFFKIKNSSVLNLEFFDIFWTIGDLLSEEIKAYDEDCKIKAKQIASNLPNEVGNIPYKCQLCNKESVIKDFSGSIFSAKCPICLKNFRPSAKELIENLYFR